MESSICLSAGRTTGMSNPIKQDFRVNTLSDNSYFAASRSNFVMDFDPDASSHYGDIKGEVEKNESQMDNFIAELGLSLDDGSFDTNKSYTKTVEKDSKTKINTTTYTAPDGSKVVSEDKPGFLFGSTPVSKKLYDENGALVKECSYIDANTQLVTNYNEDGSKLCEATLHYNKGNLTHSADVKIYLDDGNYVTINLKHCISNSIGNNGDGISEIGMCDKDGNKIKKGNMNQDQQQALIDVLSKYEECI